MRCTELSRVVTMRMTFLYSSIANWFRRLPGTPPLASFVICPSARPKSTRSVLEELFVIWTFLPFLSGAMGSVSLS